MSTQELGEERIGTPKGGLVWKCSVIANVLYIFMTIEYFTGWGMMLYKKYFPPTPPSATHSHTFDCYQKFIDEYTLEIYKDSNIPAIMTIHTDCNRNEIEIKSFSLRYYANALTQISKSKAMELAVIQDNIPVDDRRCIMHVYRDTKKTFAILAPILDEKTTLGFFGSMESCVTAKKTLRKIYNANTTLKDKVRTFKSYGNAITITTAGELEPGSSFRYKRGGVVIAKAEEAYNTITNSNIDVRYGKDDTGRINTVYSAINLNDVTRNACVTCHSLDNYCKAHP